MQIAGSVEDRTAYDVNVPDSFVLMKRFGNPVQNPPCRGIRFLEPFPARGLIVWVNFLKEFFESPVPAQREFENPHESGREQGTVRESDSATRRILNWITESFIRTKSPGHSRRRPCGPRPTRRSA